MQRSRLVIISISIFFAPVQGGSFLRFLKDHGPADIQEQLKNIPANYSGVIVINATEQVNNNKQDINISLMGADFFKASWYKECATSVKQSIATGAHSTWQYIRHHKAAVACASIVGTYVAVQAKLILLTKRLNKQPSWSLWHVEGTQPDQSLVTKHLLQDIYSMYINDKHPVDFTKSLTAFITDIKQEQRDLEQYPKLINTLKSCKLAKLFWYKEHLLATVAQRATHLAWVKKIFTAWLSEYNTQQSLTYKPKKI